MTFLDLVGWISTDMGHFLQEQGVGIQEEEDATPVCNGCHTTLVLISGICEIEGDFFTGTPLKSISMENLG